ncbi:hypothetical protein PT974_02032 [Cladobotryum mycophilum]|uniref:Uncharacterized protein n=1 Tax=Cladobotryum mycophilum TaxID=491253 RepID=A0ABR0SXU6_9HYPO
MEPNATKSIGKLNQVIPPPPNELLLRLRCISNTKLGPSTTLNIALADMLRKDVLLTQKWIVLDVVPDFRHMDGAFELSSLLVCNLIEGFEKTSIAMGALQRILETAFPELNAKYSNLRQHVLGLVKYGAFGTTAFIVLALGSALGGAQAYESGLFLCNKIISYWFTSSTVAVAAGSFVS